MHFCIPSIQIYKTSNHVSIKIEKRSPKTYHHLFLEKYFSRYDLVDFLNSYFTTSLALEKCDEEEKIRGLKLWFCNDITPMGLKERKDCN